MKRDRTKCVVAVPRSTTRRLVHSSSSPYVGREIDLDVYMPPKTRRAPRLLEARAPVPLPPMRRPRTAAVVQKKRTAAVVQKKRTPTFLTDFNMSLSSGHALAKQVWPLPAEEDRTPTFLTEAAGTSLSFGRTGDMARPVPQRAATAQENVANDAHSCSDRVPFSRGRSRDNVLPRSPAKDVQFPAVVGGETAAPARKSARVPTFLTDLNASLSTAPDLPMFSLLSRDDEEHRRLERLGQRRDSLCESSEPLVVEDVSLNDLAFLEAFATPRVPRKLTSSSASQTVTVSTVTDLSSQRPRVSPKKKDGLNTTREIRPNAIGSPEFQARLVAAAEDAVERTMSDGYQEDTIASRSDYLSDMLRELKKRRSFQETCEDLSAAPSPSSHRQPAGFSMRSSRATEAAAFQPSRKNKEFKKRPYTAPKQELRSAAASERVPVRATSASVSGAKKLEYLRLLGRGGSAKVYLCRLHHAGASELLAVKQLLTHGKSKDNANEIGRVLRLEVDTLRRLRHPNIVTYRGMHFSKRRKEYHILLEYVDGGSLVDLVKRCDAGIPLNRLVPIVAQIVGGVAYLHRQRVIHRDLKPANILISKKGKVKITDFDISTQVCGMNTKERSCVGTPWYTAPEVINLKPYSFSADIWSLGASVFHLATGSCPYASSSAIAAMFKLVNEGAPPLPPGMDANLK